MNLGFYDIVSLDADGVTYELKKVNSAMIDGYSIAERLLEGVRFVLTIHEGGLEVSVHPDDQDYFEQFNQMKFYKLVLEEAKNEHALMGETVLYDRDKVFSDQVDFWEAEPRFVD